MKSPKFGVKYMQRTGKETHFAEQTESSLSALNCSTKLQH